MVYETLYNCCTFGNSQVMYCHYTECRLGACKAWYTHSAINEEWAEHRFCQEIVHAEYATE